MTLSHRIGGIGASLVLIAISIAVLEMIFAACMGIVDFYTPNFVYPTSGLVNIDLMGPVMLLMGLCGLAMIGVSGLLKRETP